MSDSAEEADAQRVALAFATKATSMLEWLTTEDLVQMLESYIRCNSRRHDDLLRFVFGYGAIARAGIPLAVTFARASA